MAKKPKKKPPFNLNSAVRSAIRRVFSRSPIVIEAMKKVRRERPWLKKDGSKASKPRVEYLCASCGEYHMGKNIQVDHRIPVIDQAVGFVSWEVFIERLFCGPENLDVLCKPCHKQKSDIEKKLGVERRKRLKEVAK